MTLNKIYNWRFPWGFFQGMTVYLYVVNGQPNKIQFVETIPSRRNGQRRLFYIYIAICPGEAHPERKRISLCPKISSYCVSGNLPIG